MKVHPLLLCILVAIPALAAWPAYTAHGVTAARAALVPVAAPVKQDYVERNTLIAFWERAVREKHPNDMLSPRQLAGEYLQRYRETGDIDDVTRAQHSAEQSLAIMPRNIAAIDEMAQVMLALHRFEPALAYVDKLLPYDPGNVGFLTQKASLEMELGRYAAADATLRRIRAADRSSAASETVRSRYDELTGNLEHSRDLLADATTQVDAQFEEPAQARAWYHFRAGELAFEAGDNDAAIRDERDALAIFPTYNLALKNLAKFELANHRYREAREAAAKGALVTPFAETLGYEADAQAALGDVRGAATTRDVIFAIERLGNASRVNDRLLAIYYADHRLRPADALAIARREAAVRGDEIYAQDTLAWAAAMDGQWVEARQAAAKATRYRIEDPIVSYHCGVIALHFGERDEAKRRLRGALAANPFFHPVYANEARRILAQL